MFKKSNFRSH